MNETTDQTNFWLGWRATCAAADCTDVAKLSKACEQDPQSYWTVLSDLEGTAALSMEIIKSMNKKFKESMAFFNNLYGKRRNSEFMDEVDGWSDTSPRDGCAFMLLEEYLYDKKAIKGRPFKNYLFEDVGGRSGGLGPNLCGYAKLTLRTIARNSFSKALRDLPREGNDGELLPENEGSTEERVDLTSLPANERAEINEVIRFFGEYVDELGSSDGDESPAWDQDHWISIYCALHQMPINNPDVAGLCRRSKSMLAVVYKQTVNNLLLVLRKRLRASDRAIARAMDTGIPAILDEKMKGMPFYGELEAIRLQRLVK